MFNRCDESGKKTDICFFFPSPGFRFVTVLVAQTKIARDVFIYYDDGPLRQEVSLSCKKGRTKRKGGNSAEKEETREAGNDDDGDDDRDGNYYWDDFHDYYDNWKNDDTDERQPQPQPQRH